MFTILYKSLVRPILEYASPVWSPYLKKDIMRLEKVQRRATKLIPSLHNLSYSERLVKLGLPTLTYRRDRQDLVQVFNILNSDPTTHLFTLDTDHRLRNNGRYIKKTEHYNGMIRQKFFTQRIINVWNKLPSYVVNARSLNTFKSSLNSIDWHQKKFNVDLSISHLTVWNMSCILLNMTLQNQHSRSFVIHLLYT